MLDSVAIVPSEVSDGKIIFTISPRKLKNYQESGFYWTGEPKDSIERFTGFSPGLIATITGGILRQPLCLIRQEVSVSCCSFLWNRLALDIMNMINLFML